MAPETEDTVPLKDEQARTDQKRRASPSQSHTTSPAILIQDTTIPSGPYGTGSLASTLAVRDEQAARTRGGIKLALVVTAVTMVVMQLPERQDPRGLWIATAGIASVFIAAFVLWLMQRGGRDFDPRYGAVIGLTGVPAALCVLYHVGVYSPVALVLFVLVYYFGLGDYERESQWIFGLSAVGYLALASATIVGWIDPTKSVLALNAPERAALIAIAIVVEVFLVMTYWLARVSRRATVMAMTRLENAQRQIRKRDALLNEARADLQDAFGAARFGRYTDRDIGPFRAAEVIGRGGMGEVYSAVERAGKRLVAIKLLHPHALENALQVERFFREARVSSELRSPHIVEVFENGTTADGTPYLAMEKLNGHDLSWHLRDRGRFTVPDALELVEQIAAGLRVAHKAGVVHRDLKPNNVFFDERRGVWKILDFGVSKIHDSAGTLTHGDAIGTPSYMAPEQATGKTLDHRADVFALGVIAYRVLTGRPAFTGKDAVSTMYNVVKHQPLKPSSFAPLGEQVDWVIALALAKKPKHRFAHAHEFAAAFAKAVMGKLSPQLQDRAEELLAQRPWRTDDSRATRVDQRPASELATKVDWLGEDKKSKAPATEG